MPIKITRKTFRDICEFMFNAGAAWAFDEYKTNTSREELKQQTAKAYARYGNKPAKRAKKGKAGNSSYGPQKINL